MQTIKIKSLYPPTIVNFPTGGRYVVSGSNWISVNDDVTMNDVKWIPSHKSKKSDYRFYKKEWSVEGSNGNSYKVKYQKGFGWWCGCLGFSFRKKCKHITDLKKRYKNN